MPILSQLPRGIAPSLPRGASWSRGAASLSEMSAARVAPVTVGGVVSGLVRSLRPRQWTKNSVIFAALLFSKHVGNEESVIRASIAFGVFCLLSSAVYLINDVFDLPNDRV